MARLDSGIALADDLLAQLSTPPVSPGVGLADQLLEQLSPLGPPEDAPDQPITAGEGFDPETEDEKQFVDRILKHAGEPTLGERAASFGGAFVRGAAGLVGSGLKGLDLLKKTIEQRAPIFLANLNKDKDVRDYFYYKIGQGIEDAANKWLPADPRVKDEFLNETVPRAFGSMAGFVATGIAGRAVAGARAGLAVTGGVGALSEGAVLAEDVAAIGASEEDQLNAFLLGLPIGATELLPVARILRRFDRASGGQLKRTLRSVVREVGMGAAEETLQEGVQTVLSNAAAKKMGDKERKLLEGLLESGGAGGIVGAVTNAIAVLAGGAPLRRVLRNQEKRDAVQKEQQVAPEAGRGDRVVEGGQVAEAQAAQAAEEVGGTAGTTEKAKVTSKQELGVQEPDVEAMAGTFRSAWRRVGTGLDAAFNEFQRDIARGRESTGVKYPAIEGMIPEGGGPPVGGSVRDSEAPIPEESRERLVTALEETPQLHVSQAAERHKFLKEKAGKLAGIQARRLGRTGATMQAGALKGAQPTIAFEPINDKGQFSEKEWNAFHDHIDTHRQVTPFDKQTLHRALDNVGDFGGLPKLSELALFEKVFGIRAARALAQKAPTGQKWVRAIGELSAQARANVASFDLSAALRQGGPYALMHPKKSLRAFRAQLNALSDEAYAQQLNAGLKFGEKGERATAAGLELTQLDGPIAEREETYQQTFSDNLAEAELSGAYSSLAGVKQWAKGIRASNRAYTTHLNVLRRQVFDSYADRMEQSGLDPKNPKDAKEFERLAWSINVLTGRGAIKPETSGQLLRSMLFSTRFLASRIQAPQVIGKLLTSPTPTLRRKAYRLLMAESAMWGSVVAMVALAIQAFPELDLEAESDPRSPDFGKLRFGDTRVDFGQGYGQITRLMTALGAGLLNTTTAGVTGKPQVRPTTRPEQLKDVSLELATAFFLRYKLAPIPSAAWSVFKGETPNREQATLAGLMSDLTLPISAQTLYEVVREHGAAGMGLLVPDVLGVPVNVHRFRPESKDLTGSYDRLFLTRGRKDKEGMIVAARRAAELWSDIERIKSSAKERPEVPELTADEATELRRVMEAAQDNAAIVAFGQVFADKLKSLRGDTMGRRALLKIQRIQSPVEREKARLEKLASTMMAYSSLQAGLNKEHFEGLSRDQRKALVTLTRQRKGKLLQALLAAGDDVTRLFRDKWRRMGNRVIAADRDVSDAYRRRLGMVRRSLERAKSSRPTSQ